MTDYVGFGGGKATVPTPEGRHWPEVNSDGWAKSSTYSGKQSKTTRTEVKSAVRGTMGTCSETRKELCKPGRLPELVTRSENSQCRDGTDAVSSGAANPTPRFPHRPAGLAVGRNTERRGEAQ